MTRNRSGISPVITTVILVAVSITVALSAAYWITGIYGQYVGYERIEIPTSYCTLSPSVNNSKWGIYIQLKNSGSNPTQILYIMVNGILVSEYNVSAGGSLSTPSSVGTSLIESELGLESGESINFYIWIGEDLFSSGTSVSVNMHSISGIDYMKLLKLL